MSTNQVVTCSDSTPEMGLKIPLLEKICRPSTPSIQSIQLTQLIWTRTNIECSDIVKGLHADIDMTIGARVMYIDEEPVWRRGW
jgi:hypothetical protein